MTVSATRDHAGQPPSTATSIAVFASAFECASPALRAGAMSTSLLGEEARDCRPRRVRLPTVPCTPPPGGLRSSCAAPADRTRARSRARTIAAASGCSEPLSTIATRRSRSSSCQPFERDDVRHFRLAAGDRARLVEHDGVHLAHALQAFAASCSRMPCSAPRPLPTMIAAGVARPRAQGQAITSTAIAATIAATGVARQQPADERQRGDAEDRRARRRRRPGPPVAAPAPSQSAPLDQSDDLRQLRLARRRASPASSAGPAR